MRPAEPGVARIEIECIPNRGGAVGEIQPVLLIDPERTQQALKVSDRVRPAT